MKTFLSCGGGIQSTALLYMSLNGAFGLKKPDGVLFADPGWERPKTYENIDRLRTYAHGRGVPFYIVRYGNLRDDVMDARNRNYIPIMPFHIRKRTE